MTILVGVLEQHYRVLIDTGTTLPDRSHDNFQVGEELASQRGKHSSAFSEGSHEVTHRFHVYDNTDWDE